MKCTPAEAYYLIKTTTYGVCKYCDEHYSVTSDGQLRKHKDCPKDVPYATTVWGRNHEFLGYVRLDDLALISQAGDDAHYWTIKSRKDGIWRHSLDIKT